MTDKKKDGATQSEKPVNPATKMTDEQLVCAAPNHDGWVQGDDLAPDSPEFQNHHSRNTKIVDDSDPTDRKSEIFFAAVETTRMPMVITNPRLPDNPIIFANEAFVEMTGYLLEEIVGNNCRFLQGAKTDPSAVNVIRQGVQETKEASVEMLNYKKDGTPFWNALFISPVHDPQGNLLYFFGSQLDVTRRRVAEEGLRQSQKMEALGQLTGGLAHDFNNLLQVVIGHLDRTRMKLGQVKDPTIVRSIDQALSAAEKGATLTQQLLSFARKQRLDQQTVNLNDLIRSVSEMVRRTLGRDIEYRVNLHETPLYANIDSIQAESALLNVLINARDAMPHGGTVTINTFPMTDDVVSALASPPESSSKSGFACISVTDTGTGMAQDVLDHITEPFFTTKEQGKGTGLGLSMVYGFLRQSKGTMNADSEVGRGTTISLVFPREAQFRPREADKVEHMDNRGHETILVVEDQPEVLELTAAILRDAGYTVLTATNARIALDIGRSDARFDALFTDIIMPGGMNGIALVHEMQKHRPHLRVLLTTGYAEDASSQTRDVRLPVLQKPYRPGALMEAIRAMLDLDASRDTLHTEHAG